MTSGSVVALVGGQVELEERGGHLGVGGEPLVPAEPVDLVPAAVRREQAGQHLRSERPVRPDEVDE